MVIGPRGRRTPLKRLPGPSGAGRSYRLTPDSGRFTPTPPFEPSRTQTLGPLQTSERADPERFGFPSDDRGPVWTFSTPWDQLFTYGFAVRRGRALVINKKETLISTERGLSPALRQLRALLPEVRERYEVDTLELFGSRVRDDAGKGSDLDLLVSLTETPDLLTFISLEHEPAERLGVQVDLVMRRALKPRLRDRIPGEAIPV